MISKRQLASNCLYNTQQSNISSLHGAAKSVDKRPFTHKYTHNHFQFLSLADGEYHNTSTFLTLSESVSIYSLWTTIFDIMKFRSIFYVIFFIKLYLLVV